MSYSQILRRLNRILQSTVNDVIDSFTKDEQELNDFDEELRNAQRGSSEHEQNDTHERSSSGNRQSSQHKEGHHKPGERDDAFYYSILGLTPSATKKEIKKAYRDLMRQYHPDKVATLGPELQATASKKAKEINEAYHIIERRRGFH